MVDRRKIVHLLKNSLCRNVIFLKVTAYSPELFAASLENPKTPKTLMLE
jgi:hypothetical protein